MLGLSRGEPLPLGLQERCDGVNISVFSRHASRFTLMIFEGVEQTTPVAEFELNPRHHRSGDIWHARLTGNTKGKLYAFKLDGPDAHQEGHRFDPSFTLLDPYAPAVARVTAGTDQRNNPFRCVIADQRFDWEEDVPPRRAWSETIIYETHVRGLTMHESSGATRRGQYLGVIEKIPYFSELGITALELMPVQAFNADEVQRRSPISGERLRNYWGYNPVALFAPMPDYARGEALDAALIEFKTMVRELHKADIEVILDVIFNHTAEGGEDGPVYSLRGLDNSIYYLLAPDRRRYADYTGCGNTLNCNHPIVRTMIVDCLRHWVMHFHIDGFRFDLASVLGRDACGKVLQNAPLLEQIAEDPILGQVKLIAEAWDSAGAFQVGHFASQRWAEWNCHFRDEVRRFWRGDPGMTGRFAARLTGSADLYQSDGKQPVNSINFLTCHDGFTLNDVVSYAVKHNDSNGEGNSDGLNENYSENNGLEGGTADPAIEEARVRQVKNMLVALFVSRGVPMLLGGDEFRRTQQGNNNAYCQDNEVSWYDWTLAEHHAGLVRFVRKLVELRRMHPVLTEERFYETGDIDWLGPDESSPGWNGAANVVGCFIPEKAGSALCLLFNATREARSFRLPRPPRGPWRVAVNTALRPPDDAPETGHITLVTPDTPLAVEPRATMILTSA